MQRLLLMKDQRILKSSVPSLEAPEQRQSLFELCLEYFGVCSRQHMRTENNDRTSRCSRNKPSIVAGMSPLLGRSDARIEGTNGEICNEAWHGRKEQR